MISLPLGVSTPFPGLSSFWMPPLTFFGPEQETYCFGTQFAQLHPLTPNADIRGNPFTPRPLPSVGGAPSTTSASSPLGHPPGPESAGRARTRQGEFPRRPCSHEEMDEPWAGRNALADLARGLPLRLALTGALSEERNGNAQPPARRAGASTARPPPFAGARRPTPCPPAAGPRRPSPPPSSGARSRASTHGGPGAGRGA